MFYSFDHIIVQHFKQLVDTALYVSIIIIITIIIIIMIISTITVFAGVFFVHQPGANHAPGASVTQVNLSVQILSTFLRICVDPSMQIF